MSNFTAADFFIALLSPLTVILPALYLAWRVLENGGKSAPTPPPINTSKIPSGQKTLMDMGN